MAPIRRRNPVSDCPLTAALAAMGSKWKLIIIYWLAEEPRHFAGLRQKMPAISQKVLTEQLRELEADGLIERLVTGPVPAPVRYRLSRHGETVLPLVEEARRWGQAELQRTRGAMGVPVETALGCAQEVQAGV